MSHCVFGKKEERYDWLDARPELAHSVMLNYAKASKLLTAFLFEQVIYIL